MCAWALSPFNRGRCGFTDRNPAPTEALRRSCFFAPRKTLITITPSYVVAATGAAGSERSIWTRSGFTCLTHRATPTRTQDAMKAQAFSGAEASSRVPLLIAAGFARAQPRGCPEIRGAAHLPTGSRGPSSWGRDPVNDAGASPLPRPRRAAFRFGDASCSEGQFLAARFVILVSGLS